MTEALNFQPVGNITLKISPYATAPTKVDKMMLLLRQNTSVSTTKPASVGNKR